MHTFDKQKFNIMSCENCYHVVLPQCTQEILLRAGLQESQVYFVIITDKFGNQYTIDSRTDENGDITIDVLSVPTGTFNPFAGEFKLEVKLDIDNCNAETLRFCCGNALTDYSCVMMSFMNSDIETIDAIIGCVCNDPLTPADPSAPSFKRISIISGEVDGTNDTFVLAHPPSAVYYNGNLQVAANYTITDNSVTYAFVPFLDESVDFWGTY